MLTTLASSFMTAARMDGFAYAGTATVPSQSPRREARTLLARVLASLRRLAG